MRHLNRHFENGNGPTRPESFLQDLFGVRRDKHGHHFIIRLQINECSFERRLLELLYARIPLILQKQNPKNRQQRQILLQIGYRHGNPEQPINRSSLHHTLHHRILKQLCILLLILA